MAGIMEVNEQGDILIVTPTALWKFNVEKGQWKKTSFATCNTRRLRIQADKCSQWRCVFERIIKYTGSTVMKA